MLGASRERAVAVLYVAEAAVNVTAMLLLVRSAGLVGVAWATTLPTVVAALLVWPWLLRRSFGVSVRGYLSSAWGRPVVAMLPFAGATGLVERLWPATILAVFFGQVAVLMPLALLGCWYVGLLDQERRRCRDAARALPSLLTATGR